LAGSEAVVPDVVRSEPVDLQALVRSTPQAFDDLREPTDQPVVAEEGTTFAVDGEGEASIVADVVEPDAVEPVEAEVEVEAEEVVVDEPSKEAPVVAEPDATAIAIERPTLAAEPAVETPRQSVEPPEAPVEVLATGSKDSLK
jgi:hypothetical protein